jgi:putative inorganic carbon (HCO3(-)) transporter
VNFTQWFFVYFLIINIVNTEEKFFIFYLSFLLYSFKMSQHGFISWAKIGFGWDSWGVVGGPGWFHNSGEFGIQLCMFLPLSIYFILALYKYWGKLKLAFFMLFPFTAMASIIATSSRGALVGAMAALLWMVLKSKKRAKAIIIIIMIGLVAYNFVPEESKLRLESSGEDRTSVTRIIRWEDGLEILNNNPWFGIGYRNWIIYYENHYDRESYGLPHNIFIDAAAELGYIGLSVFILMIVYTFVNNKRTRKLASQNNNDFIYYTAHGLDAALIGLVISGAFVSVLYYPYFWINMAMTVSLYNIAADAKKKSKNKKTANTDLPQLQINAHS